MRSYNALYIPVVLMCCKHVSGKVWVRVGVRVRFSVRVRVRVRVRVGG